MRTLVAELAEAPYRFIVSKGPQADEFELAPNMVGAEFLPQTSVLPQVDLVITHGGNNTVTESLFFGKPMVLLPIFWDQHDNAQRIDETGFGIRLDTYAHEPTNCPRRSPACSTTASSPTASPRPRAGCRPPAGPSSPPT